MPESLVEYAIALHRAGFVPLPIFARGKNICFPRLGLRPLHLPSRRKPLKELAFGSVSFWLAMHPPSEDDVRRWFTGHLGNIAIAGGTQNMVVLDFDQFGVFEQWRREYPELCKSTPIETTPHGIHIYVACEDTLPSSSLYMGRKKAGHLCSWGRYAVCSPSSAASGEYRWHEGCSILEKPLARIPNLAAVSLAGSHWLTSHYDAFLGRGSYRLDEGESDYGI